MMNFILKEKTILTNDTGLKTLKMGEEHQEHIQDKTKMNTALTKAINDALLNTALSALDNFIEILKQEIETDGMEVITMTLAKYKESLREEHKENKKSTTKGKAKQDKRKREPTAYNRFIGEQIKLLKESHADIPNQQRMAMAMDKWRNMSIEEKAEYKAKLNEMKSTSQSTMDVADELIEKLSNTNISS